MSTYLNFGSQNICWLKPDSEISCLMCSRLSLGNLNKWNINSFWILIIADQKLNKLLCWQNKYNWCLSTCKGKLSIMLSTILISLSEICMICLNWFGWNKLKPGLNCYESIPKERSILQLYIQMFMIYLVWLFMCVSVPLPDCSWCDVQPCNMNGTLRCNDLIGGFSCTCNHGYIGTHCQIGNYLIRLFCELLFSNDCFIMCSSCFLCLYCCVTSACFYTQS